jgi:sporulation integral membrane protein YtvI
MVKKLNIEWKRRLMITGIIAGVFLGYRYLLPVVFPFLAAWLLAGWLYPYALKIEKKTKLKKSLAGSILLILLFAVAGGGLFFIGKEILLQIKTAISNIPLILHFASLFLDKCCDVLEDMTGIGKENSRSYILTRMSGMQEQFLSEISPQTIGKIFFGLKNILVIMSGVVIIFICCILIISDMDHIRKKMADYTWMVGTRHVIDRLKKTTVTYLKAQVIIIAIVAGVCGAAFWMMGSPYFLLLGIFIGIMDALPIIGTGTFLYPAALFFIIKGNTGIAVGCVILDLVTSLLREYLEPRLLGGKLGVSPIVVIASVYIGIFLYGGLGVFLGPLSFSTIYEIGREWDIWD